MKLFIHSKEVELTNRYNTIKWYIISVYIIFREKNYTNKLLTTIIFRIIDKIIYIQFYESILCTS